MDREIFIFPVQLTTSRIGNHTRLIRTLAIFVTIHDWIALREISNRSRGANVCATYFVPGSKVPAYITVIIDIAVIVIDRAP